MLQMDPHCGFHLSLLNDCITGGRYPKKVGVNFPVFRNNNSLVITSSNFDIVSLIVCVMNASFVDEPCR